MRKGTLRSRYSESVPARGGKAERVERIAREASKQCGRAWLMEVGEDVSLAELMKLPGDGRVEMVMADVSGSGYESSGAEVVRLLVGPEGGWREDELGAARSAGVRVVCLGPHVMRIETAAVVGAAMVILDA
jgi:16S rRNA (uracil1498-N3)-methyltransferase